MGKKNGITETKEILAPMGKQRPSRATRKEDVMYCTVPLLERCVVFLKQLVPQGPPLLFLVVLLLVQCRHLLFLGVQLGLWWSRGVRDHGSVVDGSVDVEMVVDGTGCVVVV